MLRIMKISAILGTLIFYLIIPHLGFSQANHKILVVAGGHRFDTLNFFSLFREMDDFEFDTIMQPRANQLIASGNANHYHSIVFYDSWKTITEKEKEAYKALLQKGTGMVFMHHALVSYQDWPEFKNIIGGRYKSPKFKGDTVNISAYMHDIDMFVTTNQNHPVTKGIDSFEIHDEGYMKFDLKPGIVPLLETKHQYSDSIIGWAHQVENSRIIYLMPGHDKNGFGNATYKSILKKSIRWVSQQ
jgi:uncharacterized protein